MAKTDVTLVLPGLAGIVGREINHSALPPYFSNIVGRSIKTEHQLGLSRLLLQLITGQACSGSDIPLVNHDGVRANTIKADPCYLHPDRDRLLLFAKGIELSDSESQQLIAEIQPLLDEVGTLEQSTPTSWLLHLHQQADIAFTALEDAEGQSVDKSLPVGNERKRWVRLWNEVQMQLHQSEVNQKRQELQQHPINSVWFWGAGVQTDVNVQWDEIIGDVELFKSDDLASLVSHHQVTASTRWKGKQLIVLPELDLEGDWQSQLQKWESLIFKPLWQKLSYLSLNTLSVEIPHYGRYSITPKQRWLTRNKIP